MKRPPDITEIVLQPGEFHFGDRSTRIRTLLGSCVSITMWHPTHLIGGMCHFMLPTRAQPKEELDGKYADDAIILFLLAAKSHNTTLEEYETKIFGGGDMFPGSHVTKYISVSSKNVDAALKIIEAHNLKLISQDVGSTGHRNIIFEMWSGIVWVQHQVMPQQTRLT